MLEQVSKLPSLASTLLACVASVCNQVIARKLEREQKKGGRGRGIPFFFRCCPSFLDEPREQTLATQASTLWSVRCTSSPVTVGRMNYFAAFRWVVKNLPVSSNPGLTVNKACELSWQLTPDLHQLDGWARPWGRLGIIFRALHSGFK